MSFSLKEGLTHKGADACDKSTKFPSAPNVSQNDAGRGTAKTPKTLGPRTA